jgi:hypothetical protein
LNELKAVKFSSKSSKHWYYTTMKNKVSVFKIGWVRLDKIKFKPDCTGDTEYAQVTLTDE